MSPHLGFFHAVFVLLTASGGLKLIRPAASSRALRSAQLLPMGRRSLARSAGRSLGGIEVVVGLVGLLGAAWAAPDVALLGTTSALFAGFNLFLIRLRRIDASADCGCFGDSGVGVQGGSSGRWHLWLNGVTALMVGLAAGLAVLSPGLAVQAPLLVTMAELASESLLSAASYSVLVATLAWLMAVGPGLLGGLAELRMAQP